jgi:hypothetical protein
MGAPLRLPVLFYSRGVRFSSFVWRPVFWISGLSFRVRRGGGPGVRLSGPGSSRRDRSSGWAGLGEVEAVPVVAVAGPGDQPGQPSTPRCWRAWCGRRPAGRTPRSSAGRRGRRRTAGSAAQSAAAGVVSRKRSGSGIKAGALGVGSESSMAFRCPLRARGLAGRMKRHNILEIFL